MTRPPQTVATTGSGRSRPCQGLLRDREAEASPVDHGPGRRVDQDHVGRLTGGQRPALAGQPGDPGRGDGHPSAPPRPSRAGRVDHRLQHHGRARSPARACRTRPRRRRAPCRAGRAGAWSVATASMVPSASASRRAVDVLGRPQRRVDLVRRVVAEHLVGGQQQVVRGDLGGHSIAARLGPAEHVDRLGGGDVADVQPGPGQLGQLDVAGDDGRLGRRRPAGQPEPAGDLTLVAARVAARPAAGPGRAGRSRRRRRGRTPGRGASAGRRRRSARRRRTPGPPADDRAISPSSASSAPASPLLTAPTGTTWACAVPACRGRRCARPPRRCR